MLPSSGSSSGPLALPGSPAEAERLRRSRAGSAARLESSQRAGWGERQGDCGAAAQRLVQQAPRARRARRGRGRLVSMLASVRERVCLQATSTDGVTVGVNLAQTGTLGSWELELPYPSSTPGTPSTLYSTPSVRRGRARGSGEVATSRVVIESKTKNEKVRYAPPCRSQSALVSVDCHRSIACCSTRVTPAGSGRGGRGGGAASKFFCREDGG